MVEHFASQFETWTSPLTNKTDTLFNIWTYSALSVCVLLTSVPFLFNSCQGSFSGSKGSSGSVTGSNCSPVVPRKAGLLNPVVTKISHTERVFDNKKVQLTEDSSSNLLPAFVKASASEPSVKKGVQLAAVYSNACLENALTSGLDQTSLTAKFLKNQAPSELLEEQVYSWTVDEDTSLASIEAEAAADNCMIGLAYNHTYKSAAIFNDPSYVSQTHLAVTRAGLAYDEFFNATYGMNASTGTAIKIAVIDSGIDWGHPDLQDNIWRHRYGWGLDATTLSTGGVINYNPVDDISALGGHGTHVSGLAAAITNNNLGVSGAMPLLGKIMAIKVFSASNSSTEPTTSSAIVAMAIEFARLNGAKVINLSLQESINGAVSDAVLLSAIQNAVASGIVVVSAAGNGSPNGRLINGTSFSVNPGSYGSQINGMITVGAIDTTMSSGNYNRAAYSHYSPTFVEIAAPGSVNGASQGLISTLPRTLTTSTGYGALAGTSMSAPLVSAAAALTIGFIYNKLGVWPTPATVEQLILASARKNTNLLSEFKDGNSLDLYSLALNIELTYPRIKDPTVGGGGSGGTGDPEEECP